MRAGKGNRTLIAGLENRSNSRYTIPALWIFKIKGSTWFPKSLLIQWWSVGFEPTVESFLSADPQSAAFNRSATATVTPEGLEPIISRLKVW